MGPANHADGTAGSHEVKLFSARRAIGAVIVKDKRVMTATMAHLQVGASAKNAATACTGNSTALQGHARRFATSSMSSKTPSFRWPSTLEQFCLSSDDANNLFVYFSGSSQPMDFEQNHQTLKDCLFNKVYIVSE